MDFSHEKITKIKSLTFNGLSNLEEIDFSWNNNEELWIQVHLMDQII